MGIFKKAALPVVALPRSVASITAGLSDTLAELEAHSEDSNVSAAFQRELAERALFAADEYKAESELAAKVAGNIRALLSA